MEVSNLEPFFSDPMAGRAEIQEEEEPMVPVFTVVKNGAILKNIFVINRGALPLLEDEEKEDVRPFDLMDDVEGQEEVLIVGRHPHCHIMLTHPSISRFHLKILSNPTLRKLSVMDLSSVHGTWISDSRIDPGILVELKEGDTIRVGGSSRIYRLHWVPLSQVYDCENPFISALDLAVIREKEEENAALVEDAQDDYDGVAESALATETRNACAVMEDEEISQDNDFSMANNSADLTLEHSIASSALQDLLKTENSPEFLTPVKGNLSVDRFQIDSETNPADVSLWLHWEAPSSTDNVLYIDEQSKQGPLESQNLRGYLSAATCEENASSILGNRWPYSLSRLSPSLEASALTFSPTTTSQIRNPQSGKTADITSLPVAETAKVGGNEQSLSRFSPSLEALAGSISSITPIEIESLHSGKREVVQLPWTTFEPLLQENRNHSTKRTSHPILSHPCAHETEASSNAANMFIVGGSQNQTGNQKGVLGDHIAGHSRTSKKNSSASNNNVLVELTHQHCNEENRNAESSSVKWRLFSNREKGMSNLKSSAPKSNIPRRGNPASVIQLQTGKARSKAKGATLDPHENEKQHPDRKENDTITWECSANSFEEEEEEIFTPDKENITPDTQILRSLHNIGKKESEEEEGEEEIFTPDKENMTPNTRLLRSLNKIEKMKSGGGREEEEEEEEFFTLDKEKMTPNTRLLKSLNKSSKMKSRKFIPSNSIKTRSPSKLSCLQTITTNGNILSLEKERKTLEVLRKQGTPDLQLAKHPLSEITGTRTTSARTPFQSVQASCRSHRQSISLHATGEKNSIYKKGYTGNTFSDISPDNNDGQRINWTMVVDASSLLDKESRKSLQLLRGLKGTQLMIPRMVLRELECLKRRSSYLFRRATYINSLLEWIEVCMVITPWWIHIQTKPEEETSIAPTPPGSPCSAETSFWGNQCEVNSPTAEDHVLEYAISLARTPVGKHIVLISNNVPLKIKAMAEGMICETAQEFRTSLVNPFSDRFMWRNSTARGQTWSAAHDEFLREIIYRQKSSKKKQSRGLKLILLQNSQYGKQISLH